MVLLLLSNTMLKSQSLGAPISMVKAPASVELFAPGVISTAYNERDLAISPDHQEIMYTLGTDDNSFRTIVLIKMQEGKVIQKEVAPFSGMYNDIEPFFSNDGRKVYFSSARPLHEKDTTRDYNIWYVEKVNGLWNPTAQPVSDILNTEADEFYPSVAANGNIYFTAAYPTAKGREDIFLSTFKDGEYATPISLDTSINSAKYEFNAYVSPNEDIIVFTSYGRADDLGGGDLYVSKKNAAGQWTKAKHAAAGINSPQIDYCPFIDVKTNTFYFTSNRAPVFDKQINLPDFQKILSSATNGMGNIYAVTLTQLLPK